MRLIASHGSLCVFGGGQRACKCSPRLPPLASPHRCVFGACIYGWQARGIELLPLLVKHATRIVHEARVTGVRFECADLLCCDLRELDVVMLASQCWDAALVGAVRAKLLTELAEGSLVVDYTDGLGRRDGASDDAQVQRRDFHLELTVEAPVSWDGSHRFYVWRVL